MARAAAAYRAALTALALGATALAWRQPAIRGAAIVAMLALIAVDYLLTAARPPSLHYRRSALAERIVASCPSLGRRFWPTPWCFNGHLQMALMTFRDAREPPLRFDHTERLQLSDGGMVSLDWIGLERVTESAPVLVVLPSLCGDGQSLRGFVREMQDRLGWCVVVLNRRGHGDLPLTTPCFNTLGSTSDLRVQLRHVRGRLPSSPLYVVGVSAGSGLLVRYLGEEGERAPVAAAVALCPGYDTTRAFSRVHRAYDRYMVRMLREYFLDRHQAALRSVAGYAETRASRSVAEFHDRGFRLSGFPSVAEYHRATNPMEVVEGIRVPLLVLNAADDPVCVVENVREHLGVIDAVPQTLVVLTARGSHCAFYEGVLRPASWACRVIAEYLTAVHRGAAAAPLPGPARVEADSALPRSA
jgi:predicted alpha/beta-fold hydrolase